MKGLIALVLVVIAAVNADQFSILMEFYKQTNGAKWTKSNWGGSAKDVCKWYGITCNPEGSVTEISLEANGLTGSLPSSLGGLTSLTTFDVGYNQIGGSIPESIGNLKNLMILELVGNKFEGSLPESFGNLTQLQMLDVGKNYKLKGPIPSSFGNMQTLISFVASYNMLSGTIPPTMGNLTMLGYVDLSFNQFTGPVPSGWFSQHFTVCNLANNRVNCPFPQSCQGQCVH